MYFCGVTEGLEQAVSVRLTRNMNLVNVPWQGGNKYFIEPPCKTRAAPLKLLGTEDSLCVCVCLFYFFTVLGMEARVLNMLGKHSNTELHPWPPRRFFLRKNFL
jgi:hypothetical protein